ncbi:PEP-CTERM sorting domain-containing protein [Nostoc sp. BAE]|nr:PEP-CTERM sorting domain-containing protein [Nostoc commune]MBG1258177.1 PEP-CTERM sorting domain-containing protein [Nostoc commune BAE]
MLDKALLSKVGFFIALTGTALMPAAKANAGTLVNWDDYASGWTAPTSGQTRSFASGSGTTEIKFLLGAQTSFVSFSDSGATPAINNTLNGTDPNTNKSLHVQIDPQTVGLEQGANSATLTTSFKNFGGLLEGVSFKLFDIDISSGSWQDRIILKAFAGGQIINPIFSVFDSTTVKKVGDYTLDGIKAAGNDTNNGNVTVSFASAIDGFELVFTDGDAHANRTNFNPGSHGIGIGDITYTKAVPEPTTILGLLAIGAFGISSTLKRKTQTT